MVSVSIVEIMCQYEIFRNSWALMVRGASTTLHAGLRKAKVTPPAWLECRLGGLGEDDMAEDTAARHRIRPWMWILGLFIAIVVTCISAGLQWAMPVGMTLVSIIIAVVFTVLAVLSTGMTDMTPLTAVSKSSQLVLGAMTRNGQYDKVGAETLNSIGGLMASGIAGQATDLTADFRVGYVWLLLARLCSFHGD